MDPHLAGSILASNKQKRKPKDYSLHTTKEILQRSRKKRERKGGMDGGGRKDRLKEIRNPIENILTFIHAHGERSGQGQAVLERRELTVQRMENLP